MPRVHGLFLGLAQAYLIEGTDGCVLVDTGPPGFARTVLRRVQALERRALRLIYITHAHLDHYGSAAALRRLTAAPIAVHRADAGAMARGETSIRSARGASRLIRTFYRLFESYLRPETTPADLLLDHGDDLRPHGIEATVLHTPGHTPGSSCLIVEGRLAFAGDLLSTTGRPHAQRYFADDWSLIPGSLARLQALKPDRIYPGHGRRPLSGETLQLLRPE